jgi:hypothetical protein
MPYTVTQTRLPEVLILDPKCLAMPGGVFESFNALDFAKWTGLLASFVPVHPLGDIPTNHLT